MATDLYSTRFVTCALSTSFFLLKASLLITGTASADIGACGPEVQRNCEDSPAPDSLCCSRSGKYCGSGKEYCDNCIVEWSVPGECKTNGTTSLTGVLCGRQVGGKKCAGKMCCSSHGYCGTTGAYCYEGCQSQCRFKPGVIAGIVCGALAGLALLIAISYLLRRLYVKHEGKKPPVTPNRVESVHRLFPKGAGGDKNTCLDIVLCHGFGIGCLESDAWRKTWLELDNDQVCWPEEWLGNDLSGRARIFSLEYDANVSRNRFGSNKDVSEIGKNLLQIIFGDPHKIGQSNAVVLIGHSFGGLVIKSLVVEADYAALRPGQDSYARLHAQQCGKFLNNLKLFVFYAVPHSGAPDLEKYIGKCSNLYRIWGRSQNPRPELLDNIREFSTKMDELSRKFEGFVNSNSDRSERLIIYAFTEGMPMTRADSEVVVPHPSAIRLSDNNYYKIEAANHITVCRPKTNKDHSYQKLLELLTGIIGRLQTSLNLDNPALNQVGAILDDEHVSKPLLVT